MATKTELLAHINYLHSLGLGYAPPRDMALQTRDGWLDVLGHLDIGTIQNATRAYLSGPKGQAWPQPAAIQEVVGHQRGGQAYQVRRGTDCPSCQGRGAASICLIYRGSGGRLLSSPRFGRCRCGAGDQPRLMELSALLDLFRGPGGPARQPGLVDVVELDAEWGPTYAQALAEVWDGGAVQPQHRQHAWRRVEERARPCGPLQALRRLEVPPEPRPERGEVVPFMPPARPDEGWEQQPEWLGGA